MINESFSEDDKKLVVNFNRLGDRLRPHVLKLANFIIGNLFYIVLALFASLFLLEFIRGRCSKAKKMVELTGRFEEINLKGKNDGFCATKGQRLGSEKVDEKAKNEDGPAQEAPHKKRTKRNICKKVMGAYMFDKLRSVVNWIAYKPNPLIQIFYLVIAVGGFIVYIQRGFGYIPGPYIGNYHKYIASVIMMVCYFSFY
mmetsp:Transcript_5440/g.9178  ORF Transcript_5440/g.9178 Transcript_5440/m.9178 type:complete len:199 (+) Transcript_5440:108-704(+)